MNVRDEQSKQLQDLGETFVKAVATRDFEWMLSAVADDVRFRLLLPSGPQALVGATEVVGRFVDWFAAADEIHLEFSSVDSAVGRLVLSYRIRLHDAGGWQLIEQHLVADAAEDGRLESIDLLCSGFLRDPDVASDAGATHQFDAGNLGCSDGLAGEFKRRIAAIPVGDVLVVTARDPAAKEDLPPLARMMGHEVRSTETPGDGRLVIAVERGR